MGQLITNSQLSVKRIDIKEFEKLCAPLAELIQKEYGMHARVIVECDRAVLVTDKMGVGFKVPD